MRNDWVRSMRRLRRNHLEWVLLVLLAVFGPSASADEGDRVRIEAKWNQLMADARDARDQTRYADAEQILRSALLLAEQFGSQDPLYAESLNSLAISVQIRGGYDE